MLALVALLGLLLLAPAAPARADAIDDYIKTEMERRHTFFLTADNVVADFLSSTE